MSFLGKDFEPFLEINRKAAAQSLENGSRAFGLVESETEKMLDYVVFITNVEKKFQVF